MDNSTQCIRCGEMIPFKEKALGVFLFAQTTGLHPRQKSRAGKISFCSSCAVSLAMGPAPSGAINEAAWFVIRNLVSADPALSEVAWEKLNRTAEAIVLINSRIAPAAQHASASDLAVVM